MITREDVETIERAAESLVRLRDMRSALELWALALRLRNALQEVSRGSVT